MLKRHKASVKTKNKKTKRLKEKKKKNGY